MAEKTQKLQFVIDAENRAKRVFQDASREIGSFQNKINNLQPAFKKMAKVGTVALTGIVAGLGSMIKQAAKMETLEVSFETMLGSAEKAKDMLEDLTNFTARTPFQFEGVAKSARQLLSFGVEAENIKEKLRFLGDIAAGANIPLSEMAAIFGKSMAKGKAMTEELLQLSDRGVPIIKVLAKQLGVTGEEIFDMASKGQISFSILQTALKSMSDEGGIFFDLMNKQSATLEGRISTLKDNFQLLSIQLGQHFIPIVGDLVEKAMSAVKVFSDWAEKNPETAKSLINISLAIAGIVAGLGIFGMIMPKIISGVKLLTLSFNPWILALEAALVALTAIGIEWKKLVDESAESTKSYIELEKSALKLEEAIKGAEERGDIERLKKLEKMRQESLDIASAGLRTESLGFFKKAEMGIKGYFGGEEAISDLLPQPISSANAPAPVNKNFNFTFNGDVVDKQAFLQIIKNEINRDAELELVSGQ